MDEILNLSQFLRVFLPTLVGKRCNTSLNIGTGISEQIL